MLKKLGENDKNVIVNMLGAFLVKGGSLIISVLLLPAYINFFENQTILGVWYTILSVLNWMSLFDLGLGNGLRNKLPGVIEKNDRISVRKYISTTYFVMFAMAFVVSGVGMIVIPFVNWNTIFNVGVELISQHELVNCVKIVFLGIMIQLVLKIITSILYALQKSAVVNALALSSNAIILMAVLVIPSYDLTTNLRNMSFINAIAVNIPYIICTILIFLKSLKDSVPSVKFFEKKFIKDVLGVGITLLWLTLVFMVISSTNEMLITYFTSPDNVVYYQAYNKIFNTGAMVFSLALTPIWSAVTQAQAKNDYLWIKKIYKRFLLATLGCFVIELCIIPLLQFIMNIWLGKDTIVVIPAYAIAFAILSTIMILHNVNTSIGNGMSYFKIQVIGMTMAAVFFIPLSYLFVRLFGSWIGIVWSAIICLLPYEFIAPYYTFRHLNRKLTKQSEDIL
jgi:O-antigen/teichoic acid export membrane protein